MTALLYYRQSLFPQEELEAAQKYFDCYSSYLPVRQGDHVVARYSMLPFYRDQERDISMLGGTLLNSYRDHRYVADLQNWYFDLEGLTPKTWFRLEDLPDDDTTCYVLKGETNSAKFLWSTHCFARGKAAAIQVHSRLQEDSLISYQNIYIREFVMLHNYMVALHGLPISKEFRFFIYKGKILSGAFYWSSHLEEIAETPKASEVPTVFLQKVMDRVGDNVPFYVVDVAQTASGDWIVIELNDGQQSGLSCNDPNVLYENLRIQIDDDSARDSIRCG